MIDFEYIFDEKIFVNRENFQLYFRTFFPHRQMFFD